MTITSSVRFTIIKVGGGGGFSPIILETLILKGKARTSPNFLRVVLSPCLIYVVYHYWRAKRASAEGRFLEFLNNYLSLKCSQILT